MKRLNKKGFTLVELLVVIVILGVIMSIAIPSITSSIERSKDKQKTQIIKLIEPITLNQLIEDGLITKEEMKDPFNEKRTLCGYLGYDGKKVSWNETSGSNQYCLSIE